MPRGGKTVGTLPKGVPVPALPWTKWSDVGPLLVGAVGIILVSLTDTIATATNFASRRGDEVDPDQEMVVVSSGIRSGGWHRTAPAWIVLQCNVVTDIDVTAAEVLKALDEELNDRGVHLAFVEPRDRLQDLVRRYGLNTTLDREHFYPSLDQALDVISNAAEDSPMPPYEGMPPP